MSQRLKPLFVTGSLVHGGAERHAITLMNALAARGHHCAAVYVKNDPSQLARIRRPEVAPVLCLDAGRFLDGGAVDDFAGHLARLAPSVLVAANGYALMVATLARWRAGLRTPLVVTYHTTHLQDLREEAKALIDRPFFWHADRTVFVSERQRRHWRRRLLCSRHNVVIHNGVDLTHFRPALAPEDRLAWREAQGFAPDDFVIAIPAVLRPEKNHRQLVEAVARLRGMGVPARLLIIGDGPLRGLLEALAETLAIVDSVRITGFALDVRPYLEMADAVVLCSLSETFSLAALEAMAMARPVVLSDVGGAAEMVVPGQNGYLFPVGDDEALVRRLLSLVNRRRAERMGSAARRMVETSFSETTMVDRYERLFLEVCGVRPDAAAQDRLPAAGIAQGERSHEHV